MINKNNKNNNNKKKNNKRIHNKKRNSALLYEFLIRHISKCLVNNNKEEANKAVSLSKKYFSKGSLLYNDLRLFNSILNTNVKSRHSAQRVINEVFLSADKINARKLDVEKSKLIKEINYNLRDKDFYNHKIPDYTVYASVQTLIKDWRNKRKILNSIDRIKLEDNVVEYLIKNKDNNTNKKLSTNPDYNNAVYKFAIERFNKKYNKKLTENQKRFLTKYIVYLISEDKDMLKNVIQKEIKNIKDKFMSIKDESIIKDSGLMKKLNNCYNKFMEIRFFDADEISEDNISEILQYIKLAEEIES